MNQIVKLKQMILAIGDLFILYFSLFLTLFIRYHYPIPQTIIEIHLEPFSYLFVVWIAIFYIIGLYELTNLKNNIDFLKKLSAALFINAGIAIAAFYLLPNVIAPKTNLFLILLFTFIIEYLWRRGYNNFINTRAPSTRILIIDSNKNAEELINHLNANPQLGYVISYWLKDEINDQLIKNIDQIITSNKINLIVIPNHLKHNSQTTRAIYKNFTLGIKTIDFAALYEIIFRKIPITDVEETWFIDNLINSHKIYESLKRPLEVILAFLLLIMTSPITLLIGLLVRVSSYGPTIFKQTRVGQHNKIFTLYKFRTMVIDAEKNGAQWSQPNDQRVTAIGRFLRRSHLDELPQLINIIKGEISFIGPRPERPEFTNKLKEIIPFYELRHVIRPGIAGWAQLKYRYGASVEDAQEKLQYDIYYLKNRSFWLDVGIIIKTLKLFFISN